MFAGGGGGGRGGEVGLFNKGSDKTFFTLEAFHSFDN